MIEETFKNKRQDNKRVVNAILKDIEKLPMIAKETDIAIGTIWVNKKQLVELINQYK